MRVNLEHAGDKQRTFRRTHLRDVKRIDDIEI
jgi:hypothetical protein